MGTYYSEEGLRVQSGFFDHFLRGDDTAILDTPPVRIEVRDDADTVTAVRHPASWSPHDTNWRATHLDACGNALLPVPSRIAGERRFDIRRGHVSFTYRFQEDAEIVGPMLLTVPISVTGTDDISLFAGARKFRGGRGIWFQGSYGFPFDLFTHGMLVASHRRVDPDRSLPYQPFHPFTEPEPLNPGRPVKLQIELLPSATLFRAGDELRLDVQGRWFFSRNPLVGQFPPAYAPTSAGIIQRTAAIRFLIAGIVLLGVAIVNLFVVVQDWSSATSSGFIGDHAMPLVGVVIGAGLVVSGLVKYFWR